MKFTKMHGIGNDYVYVNCFEETVDDPEELSVKISDRHFGIGADGLILICPSEKADFRMRMFNADGSEGIMCGNGTRCIGKYVYDHKMTDKTEITLETLGGIKKIKLYPEDGLVKTAEVDMGEAILKPENIPVAVQGESFINVPVTAGEMNVHITAVSMGNPHAVIFMDKDTIYDLDLEKIGPHFENHSLFPQRVNTEFIEVLSENNLKMRVWERGSGETWACGTGACASVVAACLNGYCKRDTEVTVNLRGGDLQITWRSDGHVIMRGPAVTVFDGEINIERI